VFDDGPSGIELTSLSDGNLIANNPSQGHTYDLADRGGTGNCWRNNDFTTSFGTIDC
jgi:hypothetical protein